MPGKFFLEWNAINETEVLSLRNTQIISSSNTSFEIYLNKTSSYVLTSPGYPEGMSFLCLNIIKLLIKTKVMPID